MVLRAVQKTQNGLHIRQQLHTKVFYLCVLHQPIFSLEKQLH